MAGVAAALIFVLTFTIDGAIRPGYDPLSMFVSELSLGPGGWVQRANFLASGTLIVVFSWAVDRAARAGRNGRLTAVALAIQGACLALSGVFNTDPSSMFNQVTPEGAVHGVLGAVFFTCMPLSCFLVALRLGGLRAAMPLRRSALVVGVALIILIVVLKASQTPGGSLWAWKGLIQRGLLVLYLTWLARFGAALLRRPPASVKT